MLGTTSKQSKLASICYGIAIGLLMVPFSLCYNDSPSREGHTRQSGYISTIASAMIFTSGVFLPEVYSCPVTVLEHRSDKTSDGISIGCVCVRGRVRVRVSMCVRSVPQHFAKKATLVSSNSMSAILGLFLEMEELFSESPAAARDF